MHDAELFVLSRMAWIIKGDLYKHKFTIEKEEKRHVWFLGVLVLRKSSNEIEFDVYRKIYIPKFIISELAHSYQH